MNRPAPIDRVPDAVAHDVIERLVESEFRKTLAGGRADVPDYVVINGHPYRVAEYLGATP